MKNWFGIESQNNCGLSDSISLNCLQVQEASFFFSLSRSNVMLVCDLRDQCECGQLS